MQTRRKLFQTIIGLTGGGLFATKSFAMIKPTSIKHYCASYYASTPAWAKIYQKYNSPAPAWARYALTAFDQGRGKSITIFGPDKCGKTTCYTAAVFSYLPQPGIIPDFNDQQPKLFGRGGPVHFAVFRWSGYRAKKNIHKICVVTHNRDGTIDRVKWFDTEIKLSLMGNTGIFPVIKNTPRSVECSS